MDQIGPSGQVTTLVHFTHEVNGQWRVACMPGMTEFGETPYHRNVQRSNDVRAVSCPGCKASSAFKQADEALTAALGRTARG